MPFSFEPCPIAGLYEIQPRVFGDSRGYFFEAWSERDFAAAGLNLAFVQDNQSRSTKGVLRGLHFQKTHPQGKLVRAIEGEVFDVAVDIRPGSPSYGKWHGVILSGEKQNQYYIPPGFAHGFLVLSETAVFAYKCTDFYHPEDEGGVIWNDPAIGIKWPDLGMAYLLSDKDKKLPFFAALKTKGRFSAEKPQVWLIGNKGMLGTELSLLLEKKGIPHTGTDREVDITDPAALAAFVEKQAAAGQPITWIINCAAYTAVDKAEDDAETCRRLNTAGPGNIAATAKKIGARLIHFSTDYVFDGKGSRPRKEDDPTDPIGVYGLTKRDGERRVLAANEASWIIRTAWLYGKQGNNFVHTMLRLMQERDSVSVVNDQRGSPTWAYDLACTVTLFIAALEGGKTVPPGIYHYTNDGNITWFDFAQQIYTQGKKLGLLTKDCAVKPCTSAEFPAKVRRPAYSVLDKSKVKAVLGIEIPTWDASLEEYLKSCVP